jgi:hypothetical protein
LRIGRSFLIEDGAVASSAGFYSPETHGLRGRYMEAVITFGKAFTIAFSA